MNTIEQQLRDLLIGLPATAKIWITQAASDTTVEVGYMVDGKSYAIVHRFSDEDTIIGVAKKCVDALTQDLLARKQFREKLEAAQPANQPFEIQVLSTEPGFEVDEERGLVRFPDSSPKSEIRNPKSP